MELGCERIYCLTKEIPLTGKCQILVLIFFVTREMDSLNLEIFGSGAENFNIEFSFCCGILCQFDQGYYIQMQTQ